MEGVVVRDDGGRAWRGTPAGPGALRMEDGQQPPWEREEGIAQRLRRSVTLLTPRPQTSSLHTERE